MGLAGECRVIIEQQTNTVRQLLDSNVGRSEE